MRQQVKNRLILAGVVLLFAAPLLTAFVLNYEGWHPQNRRNSGTLVDPPRDVVMVPLTLVDGAKFVWRDPQWQWTLLALPGANCESQCRTRLDEVLRMRLTLGRNAARLRIIYLGPALPTEFVTVRAPLLAGNDDTARFADYRAKGNDELALALVDPNGLLMLRYADGYSAQGARSDIQRVFH